jgi:superkiller protein 3
MNQHHNALSAYKRAIIISPRDARAYCYMGWSHDSLKEYIQAVAAYEKAVAIDPNYAEAYYSMGLAYGRQRQDSKAVAAYRKAVAAKPDYALAYYGMAVVYERIANASDASRRLRVMLDRHKAGRRVDRTAVAKYLAEYKRLKDLAITAYGQYLRLEPRGTLASSSRAAIRRLQN